MLKYNIKMRHVKVFFEILRLITLCVFISIRRWFSSTIDYHGTVWYIQPYYSKCDNRTQYRVKILKYVRDIKDVEEFGRFVKNCIMNNCFN